MDNLVFLDHRVVGFPQSNTGCVVMVDSISLDDRFFGPIQTNALPLNFDKETVTGVADHTILQDKFGILHREKVVGLRIYRIYFAIIYVQSRSRLGAYLVLTVALHVQL